MHMHNVLNVYICIRFYFNLVYIYIIYIYIYVCVCVCVCVCVYCINEGNKTYVPALWNNEGGLVTTKISNYM